MGKIEVDMTKEINHELLIIGSWKASKLEQLWKDASAADFDEFCRLLWGESPRRKADREAWMAEHDLPKGEGDA